jgi:flagellar protein FliJ
MKKFHYRLQKVLDVKEMVMKKTQRDLAFTQNEHAKAEKMLHEIQTGVSEYAQELENSETESASGLKRKYGYFYQLLDDVEDQKDNLLRIENQAAEIRQRLVEKQRDHKVLSKLKDKHYADFNSRMAKEEQIFLDEVAVNGNRQNLNG